MNKIEILAPGGSKEAIYAAIYSGADAVYTGTDRFSARAYAQNPTVGELCEIIDFAHIHEKKIYLTANTLLTEDELEGSFYAQIRPLYEAGLDAVIVQDFGVMDFVREHFPDLAIHASTQMTLLTAEAANLLKPYGVTRIVPARELSIGEIARMREKTGMELEVFVHGALCYCYSGQCQMSQVIGGRSGNRGMCAQPCRLSYVAEELGHTSGGQDSRKGYFLSPKDICTLGQVGALIQAGVDSFKIEGRMKKPAYAAFTSYLYRLYADAYLSGRTMDDAEVSRDVKRLADIYNRGGFSRGYLFESSKKNMIDIRRNGHFGVRVGEVVKVGPRTVDYRLTEETHSHDVVEFRDRTGRPVYEYTLKDGGRASETVTARYKKGSALRVGQGVYRTKNETLLQEISSIVQKGQKEGKAKIKGVFTASFGHPVSLEVSYGDTVCRVSGVCAEKATGRPVSAADIEKRLRKTADSEFEFESLDIRVPEGIFIPLGTIAALRRQAIEKLQKAICEKFHRPETAATRRRQEERSGKEQPASTYTVVRVADFAHIEGVKSCDKVNVTNTRLHVKLDEFTPDKWERLGREIGEFRYYISLPAVLRAKNSDRFLLWWKNHASGFNSERCAGVIVNSMEALPVISRMEGFKNRELLAGSGLYLWNRRSASVYRDFGIHRYLYTAYGRRTVMITEGCVKNEISGCRKFGEDRTGLCIRTPKQDEFMAVNYCDYCYNMIYEKNSSRRKPEEDPSRQLLEGVVYIPEIAFSFEDADEVRKVLNQWNYLL